MCNSRATRPADCCFEFGGEMETSDNVLEVDVNTGGIRDLWEEGMEVDAKLADTSPDMDTMDTCLDTMPDKYLDTIRDTQRDAGRESGTAPGAKSGRCCQHNNTDIRKQLGVVDARRALGDPLDAGDDEGDANKIYITREITVRDPEAERYPAAAQHIPKTTAERDHEEKNMRYPATNGTAVETIPFEPLGRLGKEGLLGIEAVATDATTIRGDRTATPAVSRRIRHAPRYTLCRRGGRTGGGGRGGCGKQAWERAGSPREPEREPRRLQNERGRDQRQSSEWRDAARMDAALLTEWVRSGQRHAATQPTAPA